jgi:hypothetical protein
MSPDDDLVVKVILDIFNSLQVLLLVIVKDSDSSSVLAFGGGIVLRCVNHMLLLPVEVLHLLFEPPGL